MSFLSSSCLGTGACNPLSLVMHFMLSKNNKAVKMLSIITVVYNDVVGIKKTISSIEDCFIKTKVRDDVEYIVVDGGSTDGTLEEILASAHVVSSYISERDAGIYNAMNKGISIANGEWFYFLNAGDTIDCFDVLAKVCENLCNLPVGCNFLYGKYRMNGVVRQQSCTLSYLICHMLNHQSVFYHRTLFLSQKYNERYRFCADYAHLLNVWSLLKPHRLNFCVANYDATGVSSQSHNKLTMWFERLHAVWHSELSLYNKVLLSLRGIFAWPYHRLNMLLRMGCNKGKGAL